MAKRETLTCARIATSQDLAQTLAAVAECGRITPAQFRTLASNLAGYIPAQATLAQRTPQGVVYVDVRTDADAFAFTVDHRARLRYR